MQRHIGETNILKKALQGELQVNPNRVKISILCKKTQNCCFNSDDLGTTKIFK